MHQDCGEFIVYRTRIGTMALVLGFASAPVTALAQSTPVSLRDSFPIGNSEGILCQVQDHSIENKANAHMFDRSWMVLCRHP